MKMRKHHNNKGHKRVKSGKTATVLRKLARKMKVDFSTTGDK